MTHSSFSSESRARGERSRWSLSADTAAARCACTLQRTFETFAFTRHSQGEEGGLLLLFHGWGSKAAKPAFAQLTRCAPYSLPLCSGFVDTCQSRSVERWLLHLDDSVTGSYQILCQPQS
eukprot:SAG31_NODE_4371_length_3302_cov_6.276616_1_plen_119_part_10